MRVERGAWGAGRVRVGAALLGAGLLLAAAGAAIGLRPSAADRRAAVSGGQGSAANPAFEPLELVDARAFVLDEAFPHLWRAEQPPVTSGVLLVLHADPAFLRPRQVAEPVLYVGDEVAERLNTAQGSGNLIALVPAPLDASGRVDLDPTTVPIWFGAPELPERIDRARARQAFLAARALGVGPAPIASGSKSRAASGRLGKASLARTLFVHDRSELELAIADLVDRYAPTEAALAESLRVPVTR